MTGLMYLSFKKLGTVVGLSKVEDLRVESLFHFIYSLIAKLILFILR